MVYSVELLQERNPWAFDSNWGLMGAEPAWRFWDVAQFNPWQNCCQGVIQKFFEPALELLLPPTLRDPGTPQGRRVWAQILGATLRPSAL
jgi:hypothetical protein